MIDIDPTTTARTDAQHSPAHRDTFRLEGMHCPGCAGAVERALQEHPHISDVRLDWKNDLVHVG